MNESKKHKNRILNFAVIGSLIAILLRKQTKLIIILVLSLLLISFICGLIYYAFIKEKDKNTLNKSVIFISFSIAVIGCLLSEIEKYKQGIESSDLPIYTVLCILQLFIALTIIGIRLCYLNRGKIENKGALYFGIGTCIFLVLSSLLVIVVTCMGI